MNYQQIYQEAKKSNYSDEEITNYLLENDPDFEKIINEAKESGYTPKEVLSFFNEKPKSKQIGLGDYVEDLGKQTVQGVGIGALGTYGDILDLFGLQPNETLPGEKAKYGRESDILEKLHSGQVPSVGELEDISDNDVIPRYSKLPSSREAEEFSQELGLVSEPKTAAGRYGKRIGKIFEGGPDLADLGRNQCDPVARREDDRTDREDRDREEDEDAEPGRGFRRHPAPFEPFEQRHERDGDDERRSHRHEELGSSAQRKGKCDDDADARDQGQRCEKPVPLGRYGLREGSRLVGDFFLDHLLLAGPRIHGASINRRSPGRQRMMVPLVRLERTLR